MLNDDGANPPNSPGERVLIVALVFAIYFISLGAPFILDDGPNILANDSIRQFSTAFSAPLGTGLAARPLINLSLAANYAISEYRVWSYHLLNIVVHASAAIALMGVVREGLGVPSLRERYGAAAPRLAFAAALIWSLHPLCTASVTYIIQRCESLYALATLLTLYGALRAWRSRERARPWQFTAIAACLAGMSSKESGLVTPLAVLLVDCVLFRHSPLRAIRRSMWMYVGFMIAAAWLTYRVITVGIESSGGREDLVSPLAYAVTQCRVVVHYLWLAVWPHDLCLDYTWPRESFSDVYPYVIAIAVMTAVVLWKLAQGRHGALLPGLAVLCLAPSSSVFPIRDMAFEHRTYLPLAWLVTALVVLVHDLASRGHVGRSRRMALLALAVTGALLGARTFKRNLDYTSEPGMWSLVTEQRPLNHRAHGNLGVSLYLRGQITEAVAPLQRSVELSPNYERGLAGLGAALAELGRCEDAIPNLEAALRINPNNATARSRLDACSAPLRGSSPLAP